LDPLSHYPTPIKVKLYFIGEQKRSLPSVHCIEFLNLCHFSNCHGTLPLSSHQIIWNPFKVLLSQYNQSLYSYLNVPQALHGCICCSTCMSTFIHTHTETTVVNLTMAFSSEVGYQPSTTAASGTTRLFICQTEVASSGQSHAKHCTNHLKTEHNVPANKIHIK
jgi:hypothetical protein